MNSQLQLPASSRSLVIIRANFVTYIYWLLPSACHRVFNPKYEYFRESLHVGIASKFNAILFRPQYVKYVNVNYRYIAELQSNPEYPFG